MAPLRVRRAGATLAKLLVTAGLVGWLIHSGLLDFSQWRGIRAGAGVWLLVGCQAVSLFVPFFRFYLLCHARRLAVSLRQAVQIGMVSYFASLVLPSTGGQDAVRVMYLRRVESGKLAEQLAAVLLDRFFGVLGLGVLGVLSGLAILLSARSAAVTGVLIGAVALTLGLLLAAALMWSGRPRWLQRQIRRWSRLALLLDALESYREVPRTLGLCLLVSICAQFGNAASMYFGFSVLGTPVSLLEATALTPLVTLAGILPLAPLGLGMADAAAEGLFATVGASNGAEVTMLVRAATVAGCLGCAVAYLWPLPKGVAAPERSSGPEGAD